MWLPNYEKQGEAAPKRFTGPKVLNETKNSGNQLEDRSLATSATTGINQQRKSPGVSPGQAAISASKSVTTSSYPSAQKSPPTLFATDSLKQNTISSDIVGYNPEQRNTKPRQIQSTDSQKRIARNDVIGATGQRNTQTNQSFNYGGNINANVGREVMGI